MSLSTDNVTNFGGAFYHQPSLHPCACRRSQLHFELYRIAGVAAARILERRHIYRHIYSSCKATWNTVRGRVAVRSFEFSDIRSMHSLGKRFGKSESTTELATE
jgi:hypothetical protein